MYPFISYISMRCKHELNSIKVNEVICIGSCLQWRGQGGCCWVVPQSALIEQTSTPALGNRGSRPIPEIIRQRGGVCECLNGSSDGHSSIIWWILRVPMCQSGHVSEFSGCILFLQDRRALFWTWIGELSPPCLARLLNHSLWVGFSQRRCLGWVRSRAWWSGLLVCCLECSCSMWMGCFWCFGGLVLCVMCDM